MKALRVTCVAGMVNIDSDDIAFGYIPGMYTGDRAGTSLQVNAHIDRRKAGVMCLAIAEAVAAFNASDNKEVAV